MSKSITVKFADGTEHIYNNVPDSVTQADAEAKAKQKYKKDILVPPSVGTQAVAAGDMAWQLANGFLSSPVGHAIELGAGGLGLYKAGKSIANTIRPTAAPVPPTGPAPIGPDGAGLPPVPGGAGQQVQGEGGRAVSGGTMTHEQALTEPSHIERRIIREANLNSGETRLPETAAPEPVRAVAPVEPSVIETPIQSGGGPRETTRYGSAASESGVSNEELLRATRQQPIPPVQAPVVDYTAPGTPTMAQGQPTIEYNMPRPVAPEFIAQEAPRGVLPQVNPPVQGEARVGVPNMNPPIPETAPTNYGQLARQYGANVLRAIPFVGAGYEGYQGAKEGLAGNQGGALEHAANAGMWLSGMPGMTAAGLTYAKPTGVGEQEQLNKLYPEQAAEAERNRQAIKFAGRQPVDQRDLEEMIIAQKHSDRLDRMIREAAAYTAMGNPGQQRP